MASESLNGLKIAILITDGFEQVEMTEPRKALDDAGAETKIVSPKEERVKAWRFTQWGDEFPVDLPRPGHQIEAKSIVDHGEAAAGELRRGDRHPGQSRQCQ